MRKYLLFFLLFGYAFCFGQKAFHQLEKDLNRKIQVSQYKPALEIINQNRSFYQEEEKKALDVLKVKILIELGLYDEALKLSQTLINSKITPEQQLQTYIQRELIFEINEDSVASKKEIDKAEQLLMDHPDLKPKNYTHFLIRKSSYYRVNGHPARAFEIANEAKKYATQMNEQENFPDIELILGLGISNISQRLGHFEHALFLYKKMQHQLAINMMYNNISRIYYNEKDYQTANKYVDSAIANLSKSTLSIYKTDLFVQKSKIMEMMKQPDSALHFYKLAFLYRQELNDEQINLKVKELAFQYNFDKEKAEKIQLRKDINNTRKLVITLAVSLLGLAYFVRQLLRSKKKIEIQKRRITDNNNELHNYLKEKQFLVQELNHRVKNNLAVILSLITFQKDQVEDEEYKRRFDDLHQRIRTIIIAHELYSYSVNHNDNALIEIQNYTRKIFDTHQQSSGRTFSYENDVEEFSLKVDRALSLGLALNELITNSLKHAVAESNMLIITLKIFVNENNMIEMEYSDNGSVFNFESKTDSLGIFIIEGMIKQLMGKCTRENANYKITFPND